MDNLYILDENNIPKKCSLEEFKDTTRLAFNDYKDGFVSTIFFGVDASLGNDEKPKLFETLVVFFDADKEDYLEKYYTYDEAIEGHKRLLEWAENGCVEGMKQEDK